MPGDEGADAVVEVYLGLGESCHRGHYKIY